MTTRHPPYKIKSQIREVRRDQDGPDGHAATNDYSPQQNAEKRTKDERLQWDAYWFFHNSKLPLKGYKGSI